MRKAENTKIPPEVEREMDSIRKAILPKMAPLFCLALINKKPRYGYDIIKESERIQNKVRDFPLKKKPMSAAMTYPLLHKLEENGLLKSEWNKRRKIYHITSKGKKQLEVGKKLWKKAINAQIKIYKEIFEGD